MNSQEKKAGAQSRITKTEQRIAAKLLKAVEDAKNGNESLAIANYDAFLHATERRLGIDAPRYDGLNMSRTATGVLNLAR